MHTKCFRTNYHISLCGLLIFHTEWVFLLCSINAVQRNNQNELRYSTIVNKGLRDAKYLYLDGSTQSIEGNTTSHEFY